MPERLKHFYKRGSLLQAWVIIIPIVAMGLGYSVGKTKNLGWKPPSSQRAAPPCHCEPKAWQSRGKPKPRAVRLLSLRLFKNVVAQFIGRTCLMNQATTFVASATTKIWVVKHPKMTAIDMMMPKERGIKIKQPCHSEGRN